MSIQDVHHIDWCSGMAQRQTHWAHGFDVLVFSRPKWSLIAKSKKLLKTHILFFVAVCDRKHPNRIPRPKVGVSVVVWANVKVVAKRLEITNRGRLFDSNQGVKVERGQLWCDRNPSWTQLRFPTVTVYLRLSFFKNFCGEHANASNK